MPFLPNLDMEFDPDGSTEQVAVVMKGKTYRDAGLNKSKFPNIEGPLYDKLCDFPRHKYRDEVRKLALNIAIMVKETNFKPTIEWLDNFMRRFCISRKKSGLSYKKNFLKIKGSKNKSQSTGQVVREAEPFQDDSHALETEQEILSDTSNEILAINVSDPLDLGEEYTAFKASNGLSENSSLLGDIANDKISNATDETILFSSSNFREAERKDAREIGDEQYSNNNGNGECPSDSDESIKEIPREMSPEKEVINLIESDDESKVSVKLEAKEQKDDNVLPSEHPIPTEESKSDSNALNKSNDEKLEQNDNEIQVKKTSKEPDKGEKDEVDAVVEEDEEEEEMEDVDDGDTTTTSSDDSESGSSSEKGNKDDDLVVKQRKSWEDMNYVDYSKKEEKFYSNNMSNLQKKLDEKITQCTACFEQVNHTVKTEIFTHPVLGVLVCKKCFRFYGKGDFNKDPDGYDEYCRWCANGGDLLLCDHCTNGFCKKCIKRNLGRGAETEAINSKSWKCYVCDLSPLTEVRAFHRAVLDQLRSVSILNKTLSRKERKEWSIKQKFTALKMKRKTQGFATGGDDSKQNLPSEFDKAMKDIQELCYLCLEQVNVVAKKSLKDQSDDAETKGQRRLLRLAHHMEKSFDKLKTSLGKTSGLNVEEILLNNSQYTSEHNSTSNKEQREKKRNHSSHRNPGTSVDTPKEAPHKQTEKRRRVSSNHDDGNESPPSKRIVLETDEEMEIEQQEPVNTATNNNKDNDGDDDDSETRKNKKNNNLLQADSSNEENAASDAPIDDAASSKNPDGDTEKEEIEDETLQTKLSPDKLKPLSQKSLSDSETEMSQSLLKDVQPSQNVSRLGLSTSEFKETKDKGTSSDDSNSSKKGIIYRKSKTLKNRVNLKSDKELSDEIDNSDENISKNESKKTSNEVKVKKKLKEDSNSSDDESKEKKVDKTKAKEGCDSKETRKKTSKSQNNMKSLLETDSDETDNSHSDEEKKFKKPSRKLHIKSKKLKRKKNSNYKPKPKSVQEAIKNKQLKSSSIKVERLPKSIQSKLEEEDYICISDYPEYFAKDVDLGLDSESDVELEAILKSKTKVKRKRKRSSSNESENDADSEDNSENEDENDPKEKEDKKPADKKSKKEKKVGLMDISLDNEEGENNDEDDTEEEDEDKKKKKAMSMNMKSLLLSSEDEKDEEIEEDAVLDSSGETLTQEELEKKKRELYEKNKKKLKEKAENSESDNDEIVKKVKKKGFLSFKFSSSEEEDDESENEKEAPRKARMFIESDSDFEVPSKKKKDFSNELFTSSSDDDDDESESSSDDSSKKSKKSKSRKRIKRPSSSTEEDEANENDLETPKKRHRRIIRDEDLLQSTKDATQEEKERRDRVKERQGRYNKIFEIDVEKDQSGKKKLILDFNEETKEELVKINEKLVSFLKPHQHDGIKFMWDTTIESLEMIQKGERGGGCILAHCMGLGKTLQVIAFIHTLLTNKHINQKISRVMVCCPVNTVYNWKAEFKQWLRGKLDTFEVVELVSAKDLWGRAYRLEDWYNEGGVCIVGYEMFRNLSNDKNKRCKGALRDKFQKYLVNPGADIMVCDEGHILKNEKTSLSIAINKIATRRRIILTGTPLQNNLKEYHCMIQFVKPNLLGSRKEFMNRFVNPIEAGQCGDALKKDVSRMKKRAHILHNLLEGCVQRFDYTVLKPFLPPKYEYVISVQMSKEQIKLYSYYLENLAQGGPKRQGSGLFVDVNNLSRIWSHPVVLFYALNRFRDQDLEEDEGSNLEGFINDSDTSDSSEEERRRKKKKKTEKDQDIEEEEVKEKIEEEKKVEGAGEDVEITEATEGLTIDGKVRRDWYKKVVEEMCSDDLDEDSFFNRFEISGKLYLLFEILREAGSIGDKVLLFSQSIMVLDMIQEFLRMVDQREIRFPPDGKEDTAKDIPQPFKHWIFEKDFYRLDGSTPAEVRKDMCKSFNNPTNERCRLFLISTKAGGVGINLVAANRVVIFDTSWNPSHDTQSIFRIYRFGQKKPCYIYRFVAQGTMEEKIYSRQVTKISTSRRVVDEHQIKRHFNMAELTELYQFTPSDPEKRETPAVPEDKLLAELLIRNRNWIVSYHEQDSLLENQTGEELTEEERNAAWEDYENEKKGIVPQKTYPGGVNLSTALPMQGIAPFDIEHIYKSVLKANPNATQAQLYESVYLATEQVQRIHISQFQNFQAVMYNMATNPMVVPELIRTSIFKDRKELITHYDSQLRVLETNIQAESNVLKQIGAITNKTVSHNAELAAGLVRGNPPPGGVSSTAQFVSRNVPVTSLVNTSFKSVSRPSTSNVNTTSASTSNNPSPGTAETASKPADQVEITLE